MYSVVQGKARKMAKEGRHKKQIVFVVRIILLVCCTAGRLLENKLQLSKSASGIGRNVCATSETCRE